MPESGERAGYDGYKRKKGSKAQVAVDTLGHLLAVAERAQVGQLCQQVQEAIAQNVKVAFADQGYSGQDAVAQAQEHAIELVVVQLPDAKKGFVLLPRRWVVERTFAWLGRFRRLARDYERLSQNLAAFHWLAAISLMLGSLAKLSKVHYRLLGLRAGRSNGDDACPTQSAAFQDVVVIICMTSESA